MFLGPRGMRRLTRRSRRALAQRDGLLVAEHGVTAPLHRELPHLSFVTASCGRTLRGLAISGFSAYCHQIGEDEQCFENCHQ